MGFFSSPKMRYNLPDRDIQRYLDTYGFGNYNYSARYNPQTGRQEWAGQPALPNYREIATGSLNEMDRGYADALGSFQRESGGNVGRFRSAVDGIVGGMGNLTDRALGEADLSPLRANQGLSRQYGQMADDTMAGRIMQIEDDYNPLIRQSTANSVMAELGRGFGSTLGQYRAAQAGANIGRAKNDAIQTATEAGLSGRLAGIDREMAANQGLFSAGLARAGLAADLGGEANRMAFSGAQTALDHDQRNAAASSLLRTQPVSFRAGVMAQPSQIYASPIVPGLTGQYDGGGIGYQMLGGALSAGFGQLVGGGIGSLFSGGGGQQPQQYGPFGY